MNERLGQYVLGDALWEDAAGRWYRARDERLGRDVLLLVFHAGTAGEGGGREQVLASARAMSKIEHDNIARVHAFDTVHGVDFLVSEWVASESVTGWFGGRRAGDEDIVRIGSRVAEALSAAHRAGVVHGCVDADHVRVDAEGAVRVVGFGLPEAEGEGASSAGVKRLALSYRSPERLRAATATATVQGDIYSLGVLLYELATGAWPFAGHSAEALLKSMSEHPARGVRKLNREVSAATERAILTCLKAQPHHRYGMVKDVASALRGAGGGVGDGSTASTRRGRSGSVLMLVIVAIVLGWAGLVWYRTGFRALTSPPHSGEVTEEP